MSEFRIPEPNPGRAKREEISFSFDDRELTGFADEPIVAALFANGVRVFRTMPTTGAALGGFCFAGRCSDCQMIVDDVPNVMACVTPLVSGMRVETQHGVGHWPVSERVE